MPNIICHTVLKQCLPCDDDPILNISAEDADSDRFLFNIDIIEHPPLGFTYSALGCKEWCYSEESLFDAQLCAVQQSTECIFDTWRPPQTDTEAPFPPPAPPTVFTNQQQECTVMCSDGSTFGAIIAAGRVSALSQAQANLVASSLACQRARQLRICIATTALTPACDETAYSFQLEARGGTPWVITFDEIAFAPFCASLGDRFPWAWTVISGSLPDGLELGECSGIISGTPTTPGTYMFTVRATDSIGSFQTKQFSLTVGEITNDSPLTDASVGIAYLVNFSTNIGDQEQQTWTVFTGSLPSGLTLSTAGVLSGTPTTAGVSNFTIKVVEAGELGVTCEKAFELEVITLPDPTAYYKLDTYPGFVPDSVNSLHMLPLFGAPNVVAAKIADGYQAPGVFTARITNAAFNTNAQDVTLRAWHNRSSIGSDSFFNIIGAGSRFISLYDTSTGADLRYGFLITDNLGNSAFVESGPVTMGDWHHVVGYVRHGVEIGLIVDNGTPITTPFLFELGVTTALRMACVALPAAPILDELAIWNGVALSTAQITTDWNSGNGRTFPF